MTVYLGSNKITVPNDERGDDLRALGAALSFCGQEVFRYRERLHDGRLLVDFHVAAQDGSTLVVVAKNEVVHAEDGYDIAHLPRESFARAKSGEYVARVRELDLDTIQITGNFWVDGNRLLITEDAVFNGRYVIRRNKFACPNPVIMVKPGSLEIGCGRPSEKR